MAALGAKHFAYVARRLEASVTAQDVRSGLVDQLSLQRHDVQAHLHQHVLQEIRLEFNSSCCSC